MDPVQFYPFVGLICTILRIYDWFSTIALHDSNVVLRDNNVVLHYGHA